MFNELYRHTTAIVLAASLSLLLFGCGGGGGGGGATPPNLSDTTAQTTYSVTGKITANGTGVAGVTVTLSSSSGKVAKAVADSVIANNVTDINGTYTFSNVTAGSYTVSSADTKYGFAATPVTVSGANANLSIAAIAAYPVFTVAGKISLTGGTPISAVTVNLYKTSFSIYSTTVNNKVFYSTKNANGESVKKIDSVVKSVTTDSSGIYSFTGVSSGKYTIQPTFATYAFKWKLESSRGDTGVITITDSGSAYLYNPDESNFGNNKLSFDRTVIYNTVVNQPFSIKDGATNYFDFEALSGAGGILIQF
jgi:hypothetical protein